MVSQRSIVVESLAFALRCLPLHHGYFVAFGVLEFADLVPESGVFILQGVDFFLLEIFEFRNSGPQPLSIIQRKQLSSALRISIKTSTSNSTAQILIDSMPDGQLLASASVDRTVRLWDPTTGATIREINTYMPVSKLSFEVYKSLAGGAGIPTVYWFGWECEYRAHGIWAAWT
jgi:hypothetical protein